MDSDLASASSERIQHLLAFWQHFALHRRESSLSGNSMISAYADDCSYPVWKRSEWIENVTRPSRVYDFARPFFEQLWDLFQLCPIPHMSGLGSENCEYCDDWWNSKDCYLCHSGVECLDCLYCYRTLKCLDCRYAVFSFHSQLCNQILDAHHCFNVHSAIHVRQCSDSAFLFDCRNCQDCFLCWNLRNKRYCIENHQYSQEEYHALRAQYDLCSRSTYQELDNRFQTLITKNAWWRAYELDRCVDSSGSFVEGLKNCTNCFFLSESEDCSDCVRGIYLKDSSFAVGSWHGELIQNSVLVGETRSYAVSNSFHVTDCSSIEYCAFCLRCKDCFACCSLIDRQYCILNQQYSAEQYAQIKSQIVQALSGQNIQSSFFPAYFSPCIYDESLAGFHFPLSQEAQETLGFRIGKRAETEGQNLPSTDSLPDKSNECGHDWLNRPLRDTQSGRKLSITNQDLILARKIGVPLPWRHYIPVIKQLFAALSYDGKLHEHTCAQCEVLLLSNFSQQTGYKILCQDCYQKL